MIWGDILSYPVASLLTSSMWHIHIWTTCLCAIANEQPGNWATDLAGMYLVLLFCICRSLAFAFDLPWLPLHWYTITDTSHHLASHHHDKVRGRLETTMHVWVLSALSRKMPQYPFWMTTKLSKKIIFHETIKNRDNRTKYNTFSSFSVELQSWSTGELQ